MIMKKKWKTCGKSEKTLEENFDIVFESNIKVPCCIVVIGALHHGECKSDSEKDFVNLYNPHTGANVYFSWTVCLHKLGVTERGVPEKICFRAFFNFWLEFFAVHGFPTFWLEFQAAKIGFEADALGKKE